MHRAFAVLAASAQAYGADSRVGFSTIPGRRPVVACAEWGGGLWESQACGRLAFRISHATSGSGCCPTPAASCKRPQLQLGYHCPKPYWSVNP